MKFLFLSSLSLTSGISLKYAYGDYESERDNAAGYPSIENIGDHKEFTELYIEKNTGRFKTPFEVANEKAVKDQEDFEKAMALKKFKVPGNMLNDWTGNRFMEHPFGVPPEDQRPGFSQSYAAHIGGVSLLQINEDGRGLEDENTPRRSPYPGSDPFDPNLADVDRIMERYERKDKEKCERAKAAARGE